MSFHFESVVDVATHHPIGAKEDNGQDEGFGSDPGFKKKLDPNQNLRLRMTHYNAKDRYVPEVCDYHIIFSHLKR